MPGLELDDDRVLRRLDVPLQPGTVVADRTARAVHARRLTRHRLTDAADRSGQLRDDRGTRRAHRPVERIGTGRRDRLTTRGLTLGARLVTLRTRRLGPLATLAAETTPPRPGPNPSLVEAASRQVDRALDQLCDAPGPTLGA